MLASLLLAASAAACDSSSGAARSSASNTVATEPAPTMTTSPYAVPAVIDEAYVNRVLAGLDAAMGEVTRLILRTQTIPPEAYDRLRSLYGDDDGLQLAIDTFQTDIRRQFSGYLPNPGNKTTTVNQVIQATRTCIFARVTRDYSLVGVNARTADTQWIALKPLDLSRDPNRFNTTSWAFAYEGYPPDRSQPPDPCGT